MQHSTSEAGCGKFAWLAQRRRTVTSRRNSELIAVVVSFCVFLLGILVFATAWPMVQEQLADERLVMLAVFGYLLALRFAGRWLARRVSGRV